MSNNWMAIAFSLALMITLAVVVSDCGGSRSKTPGGGPDQDVQAQASKPPKPLSEFEQNLQYIRNGQYAYVWVFSRRDGKALDKNDGAFLRKNAPQVVDWVGSDDGKRFIAGTNFNLEEGNLNLLRRRFVVEDYSAR